MPRTPSPSPPTTKTSIPASSAGGLAHDHAEIELRGLTCPGNVHDLSLAGALFICHTPPQESVFLRPCRLRIVADQDHILFNGLVAHARAATLGIKFIGVGDRERVALLRLLKQESGEVLLLDRDMATLMQRLPGPDYRQEP